MFIDGPVIFEDLLCVLSAHHRYSLFLCAPMVSEIFQEPPPIPLWELVVIKVVDWERKPMVNTHQGSDRFLEPIHQPVGQLLTIPSHCFLDVRVQDLKVGTSDTTTDGRSSFPLATLRALGHNLKSSI
jgi:hypothetical protein